MNTANSTASGLDGIVVAETAISDVDGEHGRLVVAGSSIEDLAGVIGFEQLCDLLWDGGSARRLAAGRELAFGKLPPLSAPDGMDALRAAAAQLSLDSADPAELPGLLTGALATFAAAWHRTRHGLPPVAPDPSLPHAADYARMVLGRLPPEPVWRALETYLVTVADHGMNASTFTARVVASTGSDLVSAVVAAIGALKGPLHGGAPGPVLDMLDAIGTPENAVPWLESELAAGRRIMGMGHRIYRVRDPRAAVLERAFEKLESAGFGGGRLALARAVESAAVGVLKQRHPGRPLQANVEFYTAILLDAIGLPRQLFSPTFAVGRVAGWCAHYFEQRAVGRLIRPASRYVG